MEQFFAKLFSSDFMPHGFCYLWQPGLIWLHAVSDGLITLSYYLIPVLLMYFVRKRRDLPFNWMFLMFGVFIFGCGTTHLLEVWTLWHGTYRLTGVVKAITAGASLTTAALLFPLIPKALALPSPESLRAEIAERKRAEAGLEEAKSELEVRVQERTTDLRNAIARLEKEVEQRKKFEAELLKAKATLIGDQQELQSLAGRLLTVQEDERRRIARELHDDLSQRLALQCNELDLYCQTVPVGSELAAALARIRRETGTLASDMRHISHDLHHPQLALGLRQGIDSLCREFSSRHGLSLDVTYDGDLRQISEATSFTLFRLLQEALTNLAKHSGVDRGSVFLGVAGNRTVLRVTDHGRGFRADGIRVPGHLGMISMRERLRLVGGALHVTSSPGRGTVVEAVVPAVV